VNIEIDGQNFQLSEGHLQDRRFQKSVRICNAAPRALPLVLTPRSLRSPWQPTALAQTHRNLPLTWLRTMVQRMRTWLLARSRVQQWACFVFLVMVLTGIKIFSQLGGWKQGVFVTLGLLMGEYIDPVNVLLSGSNGMQGLSAWLIGGPLVYSLVGTLLTSALVAVILERLLRERFGEERIRLPRRGSPPILLVEGAALAQRIGQRLRRERQVVVRVQPEGIGGVQEKGTIIYNRLEEAIHALEGRDVSAVGLLSTDLLANLEGALALQKRWPGAGMAVLAHAFGAADSLGELLGGLVVISEVDLVSDAVVATAFGERVEGVLQLQGAHLLIVRYRIQEGDTLCGLNISRLENGYGVTAVSLRRPRHSEPIVLPSPELVLADGDQLVVLATATNLRSIELGTAVSPRFRLRIRLTGATSLERSFQAQQSLARWIGCMPGDLAHLLDGAEHLTPPLDQEISELLMEDLRRQGVQCAPDHAGEAEE
jgi:hypothetical protein